MYLFVENYIRPREVVKAMESERLIRSNRRQSIGTSRTRIAVTGNLWDLRLLVLPLSGIGQVVAGLPVRAVAVLAMGFPVPFRRAVLVPFAAVFAPDEPADRSADDRLVGGEHGGISAPGGDFHH